MAVQKGKTVALLVKIGDADYVKVGATRDHGMNFTQNTIDSTTKDSGDWEEHVQMMKNMTFTMNGLHDPVQPLGRDEFISIMVNATASKIRYGQTSAVGAQLIEADVSITNYDEGSPHDGLMTWDVSILVNGEPSIVTAGS